jgi:hypothetical protein
VTFSVQVLLPLVLVAEQLRERWAELNGDDDTDGGVRDDFTRGDADDLESMEVGGGARPLEATAASGFVPVVPSSRGPSSSKMAAVPFAAASRGGDEGSEGDLRALFSATSDAVQEALASR